MAAFAPARKFSAAPPGAAPASGASPGFVELGEAEYVAYEAFAARAPVFCKPYRTGPAFAGKNPGANTVYARLCKDTGAWLLSDGKSKRFDKIFVSKGFAEGVPEFARQAGAADGDAALIVDGAGVEMAPDIVHLKPDQMFKDENGTILKIETRGERTIDRVFFRVKDVMTVFCLDTLNKIIINKDRDSYIENIEYIYFNCIKSISDSKKTGSRVKKELFLTYRGILRVLFTSRSGTAHTFVKWATETLFTAQMGSREQRTALSATLLGTSPEAVRAVFDNYEGGFPCIYLMDMGPAARLREAFSIPADTPDASRVYKYGFTKDLGRRVGEHNTDYGALPGVEVSMRCFYVIDPRYMVDAERDLRGFCRAFCKELKTDGRRELVVLSSDELAQVRAMYRRIGRDYAGNTQGMQDIINKLTEDIRQLEADMVVAELRNEVARAGLEAVAKVATVEVENRDLKLAAMAAELAAARRLLGERGGAQ